LESVILESQYKKNKQQTGSSADVQVHSVIHLEYVTKNFKRNCTILAQSMSK